MHNHVLSSWFWQDICVLAVVGLLFKAIAQAVRIGDVGWVVTPGMLQTLDCFHHRIAQRITTKVPKLVLPCRGQAMQQPTPVTIPGLNISDLRPPHPCGDHYHHLLKQV